MKNLFLILCLTFSFASHAKNIYDFNLKSISGEKLSFKKYQGKALLIVNIIGNDSFSTQLKRLEKIYRNNLDKGLVIIGIPTNGYGLNKPETILDIQTALKKYQVTFPVSDFIVAKGEDISPLFLFLENVSDKKEITWWFTKFLFNKKGILHKKYSTTMSPAGADFQAGLAKVLL